MPAVLLPYQIGQEILHSVCSLGQLQQPSKGASRHAVHPWHTVSVDETIVSGTVYPVVMVMVRAGAMVRVRG